MKSIDIEQQIQEEHRDFDESLYFRVHNERSRDARQVYRESVKAKNKKGLDQISQSTQKKKKDQRKKEDFDD